MYVIVAKYILEIEGMMWRQWLILFTTSCFGNMMGLNISAGMKSVINIYILIPLILVPQLLLGGAMIRYDDLHEAMTKKINVPVIGDLMTTRWSYEAIAVEQFRSSKYMRPYFTTEEMISRYDWQSSFLIPELRKKCNECTYVWDKPDFENVYVGNIEKLTWHITQLSEETGLDPSSAMAYVIKKPFNETVSANVNTYLDTLQKIIRARYIYYTRVKDQITDSLTIAMGRDELVRLREATHNEELADLLLNRMVLKKTFETTNRIIQKSDPVFMEPYSHYGRAHFYAPFKIIGNWRIPTLWFNMSVIWLINLLLFFTLYLNLLKRFLNLIERIKIPGFGSERLVPPWELIK
jgi:hypothetical protein